MSDIKQARQEWLDVATDSEDIAIAIDSLPDFCDDKREIKTVDWGFVSALNAHQLSEGLHCIMVELERKTQSLPKAG